jgi:V/A-type H+-transporting ATPase subunit I
MAGFTTADMSRIVVVGTSDEMPSTLEKAASIRAIHVIDHDGTDLGIGSPNQAADDISRRLAAMRGCMNQLNPKAPVVAIDIDTMRDSLAESLPKLVDSAIADIKRLENVNSELEQLQEQIGVLRRLAPMGLDIDLLSGYDSLTVNVGNVPDLADCSAVVAALSEDVYYFSNSDEGKSGNVIIFCENDSADAVEAVLSEQAFQSLQPPSGEGSAKEMLNALRAQVAELEAEAESISTGLESWNEENGGMLVGGIEVLESDFEVQTAPVRVATSNHAFILEGWVLSEEADATVAALSEVATYAEAERFKMPHGRGHHFSEEEVELPPVAFQNIKAATPYELLTNAVGRPKYGRVDPTTFMFITYPIFFGMMLGDIAYGIAIVAIAWWLSRKFARDDLVRDASKLLYYIGFSTIAFGYIFGEFAGFEYLPHLDETILTLAACSAAEVSGHWSGGHCWTGHSPSWVSWLNYLYPHQGMYHTEWIGPFGLVLAYPFHRVSANLEDLIVLTLYLGMLHLALGMVIGFRDVNKEHGFVAAMFEKGSWLIILVCGFLFIYSFLVSPGQTDAEYLDVLKLLETIGLIGLGVGIVMVIIMLWKYEGIPLPIAIGLGPLESLQVLSNTISYVRLFAVGIVGVKIAETGNEMLYEPMAHTLADISHASGMDMLLIPVLLISWLLVQIFALVLGMFSPNVQAARLHFVEWMGKFYETGGVPFTPFGKKLVNVEGD